MAKQKNHPTTPCKHRRGRVKPTQAQRMAPPTPEFLKQATYKGAHL